jgi:DNA helicase IV
MKTLSWQRPTPEQLKIIGATKLGTEVIRGAAGSGKTTTALLRLKNLFDMFDARHKRMKVDRPVKVLVLTFNRTLCGYVAALAADRLSAGAAVELKVDTFAHWAMEVLGNPTVVTSRSAIVQRLGRERGVKLPSEFLSKEIEYVLGRFPANRLGDYVTAERTGRGAVPRVDRATREGLLDVVEALKQEIASRKEIDWEDLPILISNIRSLQYDIVIVDEAQDFSANQIRAMLHHLADVSALTLVIDTVQRLYPRGYTWTEAGLDPTKVRFHRLQQNHRNTIEIARFAKGVVAGMVLDDDGTLPDFDRATRHGDLPVVVRGLYSQQLVYAINYIRRKVDLKTETIAFLKPQGGVWFKALREALDDHKIAYHDITREREWPDDDTSVILSTMHSAKGLEFDHVVILGLNAEVTSHAEDEDQLETLRRLLAMAVARARRTVLVGYKASEASDLVQYFENGTYQEIDL